MLKGVSINVMKNKLNLRYPENQKALYFFLSDAEYRREEILTAFEDVLLGITDYAETATEGGGVEIGVETSQVYSNFDDDDVEEVEFKTRALYQFTKMYIQVEQLLSKPVPISVIENREGLIIAHPTINRVAFQKIANQFEITDFIRLNNGKDKESGLIKFLFQGRTYYSTLGLYVGKTLDGRTPSIHHELVFPGDVYTVEELIVIANVLITRAHNGERLGCGVMKKSISNYSGIKPNRQNLLIQKMESVGLPALTIVSGGERIEWVYGVPVDFQTYNRMKSGKKMEKG